MLRLGESGSRPNVPWIGPLDKVLSQTEEVGMSKHASPHKLRRRNKLTENLLIQYY